MTHHFYCDIPSDIGIKICLKLHLIFKNFLGAQPQTSPRAHPFSCNIPSSDKPQESVNSKSIGSVDQYLKWEALMVM